jgi:RNA polymerase sigma factor (sigma-70 family)
MPDQALLDLLDRAARGCEEARTELVRDYSETILLTIRRRLNLIPRLRDICDSIDLLQETWLTFFTKLLQGRRFADHAALCAFLRQIAAYYLLYYTRTYIQAPKRDLRRQVPLEAAAGVADSERPPWLAAAMREQWQRLLSLCHETERMALELLCEGYTTEEVATVLDCSPRTIRRLLERLGEEMGIPK